MNITPLKREDWEGFTLIGFDSCAYTNNDIERKDVRMEMGLLLDV